MRKKYRTFLIASLVAVATGVLTYGIHLRIEPSGNGSRAEMNIGTKPKNVLLITIDTLRADHMSCYGYETKTTPHIDDLAASGALFKNATCTAPITSPSHASILTGTLPIYHGVRENGVDILSDEQTTLAEILRKEGFTTGAFVSVFVLEPEYGFEQGFDTYDATFSGSILTKVRWKVTPEYYKESASYERRADETTRAAMQWISENSDARFFLWVHYFDPHSPYYKYDESGNEILDKGGYDVSTGIIPGDHLKKSITYYNAEIRLTDLWIGRLIDRLDAMGLREHTLIVLTADHGEGLGERGYYYQHADYLFETLVQVPLIIVDPDMTQRGINISERVRNVDILPTICELVKVQVPQTVQGKSLVPLIERESQWEPLSAVSETMIPRSRGASELYSLAYRNWKLIWAPGIRGYAMYNLEEDPHEENNLIAMMQTDPKLFEQEYLGIYRDLDARLKNILSTRAGNLQPSKKEMDEETRQKLRSLGYVD